ncbi:MAG: hypothetical protein Q7U57_12755 [Methylovulum sp.]|nr:hypothetical protein [Methylovulum sp.]
MNTSVRIPKITQLKTVKFTLCAAVGLVSSMMNGCMMVGPDYQQLKLAVKEEWLEASEAMLKRGDVELGTWWTVFQDPILNRLVDEARYQNLTLQTAGIRISVPAYRGIFSITGALPIRLESQMPVFKSWRSATGTRN